MCGAISIFLERRILIGHILEAIAQLVDDGLAKHTLSLAMDEHNLASLLILVFEDCVAYFLQLIVENVAISHAGCCVEQCIDMQIDYYGSVVVILALWCARHWSVHVGVHLLHHLFL